MTDTDSTIALARRLYHHVLNGGSLTPNDMSRVVQWMEGMQRERNGLQARVDAQLEPDTSTNEDHRMTPANENTIGTMTIQPQGSIVLASGAEPERYCNNGAFGIKPDPNGDMVLYQEYASLQSRLDETVNQLDSQTFTVEHLENRCQILKARLDALDSSK